MTFQPPTLFRQLGGAGRLAAGGRAAPHPERGEGS